MTVPIFKTYAPEYAAAGLTVLPTGKKDGKVPLVPHWPRFGPRSHVRFLDKFANANIAIVDGKEVTRVDIDDPDLIDSAIKRFGETPIKVSTPSGGLHLWYRANGERRQTRIGGTKIDILGIGGIGLVPPSEHPRNGAYSFLDGCLGDLDRLPPIASNSGVAGKALNPGHGQGRNTNLHHECLRRLKGWSQATEEGILEWALEFNHRKFEVPMSATEVQKAVRSAWKIHAEGRNWVGGPARAVLTPEQWARLDPNSQYLYVYLVQNNGGRNGEPFKLYTTTASALVDPITKKCWGRTRFTKARNRLIETGDLIAIDMPKRGEQRPAIVALNPLSQNGINI